ASAYTRRYASRAITPRRVAERALDALDAFAAERPTMNVLAASNRELTLADADAATARYERGGQKGALDGVPLLVKDEFDVAGLRRRPRPRREPDRRGRRRRRFDPNPRRAQRRFRHQADLRSREPRGRRLQGLGCACRSARLYGRGSRGVPRRRRFRP